MNAKDLKELLEHEWGRKGCRFHSNLCKWRLVAVGKKSLAKMLIAEKGGSRRKVKKKDRFKHVYIDDRYNAAGLAWYRSQIAGINSQKERSL